MISIQRPTLLAEEMRAASFGPPKGHSLQVRFPENWPDEEHYDLTGWDNTKIVPDPFGRYSYP